jgi:four helix bundle protein
MAADEPNNPSKNNRYDLEERTARFGESIVGFCLSLPFNPVTRPLVSQLVRSGTSVGGNYLEADEAGSKKEFRYRISLCKRESRETKHWLRMLAPAIPDHVAKARVIWKEADELIRIFGKIYRNSKPDS